MTRRTTQLEFICEACGSGEAKHWRSETRQWICSSCLTPGELARYSQEINHSEKLRAQSVERQKVLNEKAKPDPRRGQFGYRVNYPHSQNIAIKDKSKEPKE